MSKRVYSSSESRSHSRGKKRNSPVRKEYRMANDNGGRRDNNRFREERRGHGSRSGSRERQIRHSSRRGGYSSSQERERRGANSYRGGRLSREELISQRISDRNHLRIKKSIWDFSTDDEEYQEEMAIFWERQEKEKLLINKEDKEKEEKLRLKKLRKIQKRQNASDDNDDDEDDDDVERDNMIDDQSEISSDLQSSDSSDSGRKKKKDKKKRKDKKASKKSNHYHHREESDDEVKVDEIEDSSEFESDNSFARLCREKINGPDLKKQKKSAKTKASATMNAPQQKTKKEEVDEDSQDNQFEIEENVSDYEEKPLPNINVNLIDSYLPVGPMPLMLMENKRDSNYSGLMPGEGDAIAHYVEEGKRIPRRGEVGLSSDQISKFEDLGYVMSGSRHKRMNAVRKMKEAKVISQQEKKAMAIYNYQQKNKVETKLDAYFKGMLEEQLDQNKRKEQNNS